jgi:diketogulonate reductase-like aldo/keto reductase
MATPKDVLFENAVIATLAKQYEKSPAQIMLR